MDRWTSRPSPDAPEGLILFDGVCVLCSRWVRFVISRDPEMTFRFLPIQSEAGRRFAQDMGVSPDDPDTNVVILDGRAWFKSDAALMVISRLGGAGWASRLLRLPRRLRDPAYDLIARNRYRLFGRRQVCLAPLGQDRARFLG